MKIIYVATRGTYSDYSVVGVFSTRENAQLYMDTFPDREWNDIDEYELNCGVTEIQSGKHFYVVYMQKDGKVLRTGLCDYPWISYSQIHWSSQWLGEPCVPWSSFYVWAKNETAAIKIANERRIMALAQEAT